MKPSLQIKISQQLSLTPQLAQAIKLLQLSTLDMNQEIERYLLENPLLEREDEGDAGSSVAVAEDWRGERVQEIAVREREESQETTGELTLAEVDEDRWAQDAGSYGNPGQERDRDDESESHDLQAATVSLRDHLGWQLGLSQFSDRDRALIRFLIEALDDDGYLSVPLEELLETLFTGDEEEEGLELADLEIALKQLQSLDPTGIGARSPQECLALQLEALPQEEVRDLAQKIVGEHLDVLAARDFGKLRKLLEVSDEELKTAQNLIIALDPRPGARFASLDTRYIIPDVIVRKLRGRWAAQINPDAFPRLRVNRLYAEILSQQRKSEGNMSAQLQEARWLIKNVQQRFDTIARVSQAIVDCQRAFFEYGEIAMRPLILREIAEEVGLHESTVSRVTTQKYMSTPRGIFELKYFFGSHVATDSGGACSATAIRALIRQLVGAEDGKTPLSDQQLSELLGRQGIVVARRTVAKYREALNIPSVNLRKRL
ncbi:MAG: RNA polymerase factor sigma-54 [Zoogloeaceae bacterium]|jgi:RNA polymerase sigma-54 factor|nr:RNA polymerase factor sigma-54 [Zoogloeaceae bacterium]